MKKFLAITSLIIIILSLSACNNKETAKINCSSCGKSISIDVSFCEHCGASIINVDNESADDSSNNSLPTKIPTEVTSGPSSTAQGTTKPSTTQNTSNESSTSNSKHTHNYGNETITKLPTCENQGVKTYYCAHCPSTKAETISALGHNWQDATCYSPKKCTKCLKTDGEKTDHKYFQNKCKYCSTEKIKLSDELVTLPQEINGLGGKAILTDLSYYIDDNKISFNYTVNTKEHTYDYIFYIKIVDAQKNIYTIIDGSGFTQPNQNHSQTVTCSGLDFLKLSPDVKYYILVSSW